MALDLKSKNIPAYLKAIIILVPAIILVVLFITLIYSPKNKEINVLGASIAKLDNDIATAEVKVRKLDELKAEYEKVKLKLAELQQELPEEKEVSVLLKQISDLGIKSGLTIILWKPGAKKPDPKGIYTEIPVKMEVVADYHDLGVFFAHVSNIKRIVNIKNIVMKPTKGKGVTTPIKATFTASTFSAIYASAGTVPSKK